MDETANLKLPYILAAQSQKHVTHNEALRALDAIVHLAVLDKDLAAPPSSPGEGDRYLVAAGPTGAWSGHATHVAAWQDGAWAFYVPVSGWLAWVDDESQSYLFAGGGWVPAPGGGGASLVPKGAWNSATTYATGDLVEHAGAVFLSNTDDNLDNEPDAATPGSTAEWTYFAVATGGGGGGGESINPAPLVGVNATADATNRLKVSSPASLFDHEGAGHQLKINKDEAVDTASVLFQTDYSGRAEFGLSGDDDFHVKVSANGSAWHEALVIDRTSGAVRAKSGEVDLASAGTCNIGGGAAQRVRITGTTTITSLGTVANELRFVTFAGALSLTHNATSLILPGGVNILTAAGDTAIFASNGSGNWRCLGYQRARGNALAVLVPAAPGGRLTLQSGVPVMTSSLSGQTTLYYTPHVHQIVPLYDGTDFVMTDTGGELSQATTDTTKSPAAVANTSNYDLFVWNDGGTIRCTRGPAWSSLTARGTGAGTTELERVKGILVNKIAITNGPTAQRGTYVGTIRSNGSAQIDMSMAPAPAAGPVASLHVWNAYNQVPAMANIRETTDTWTYNSTTYRRPQGASGNWISYVDGLGQSLVEAWSMVPWYRSAPTSTGAQSGLARDWSSGTPDFISLGYAVSGINTAVIMTAEGVWLPSLGGHQIDAVESAFNANTITFYGDGWHSPSQQVWSMALKMLM